MASSSAATPSPLPLPPPSSLVPTITPAALASLAIYNPSLGTTDETVHEQIVFYTSRKAAVTENDKLRQIGLAQGVVEFARGFSKSGNLNSVETAKARIVTLEIEEPGWWILAQIDLTYIHNPTPHPPTTEYTAREVSPPLLLLAQLRQCYSQFRFHYGSFASNLSTLGRAAFCKRLEKWWTRWAWRRWEVMLNGSPGIEVWDAAIKMAGGKPAREVGSEEREFLQGWAGKQKARGMVDMVVSRFGEYVDEEEVDNSASTGGSGFWFWPSTGKFVSSSSKPLTGGGKTQDKPNVIMPQDGCVFRGTGTLETNSVRDIATYLSALYLYGDESFSINSTGIRRKKRRKRPRGLAHVRSFSALVTSSPSSVESSPRISSSAIRPISEEPGNHSSTTSRFKPREDEERRGRTPEVGTEERTKKRSQSTTNAKILNLFTFGWSGNSSSQPSQQSTSSGAQNSSIRGLLHTALTPPPSEGSGGETGTEHANGPANPKPKDQPTRKKTRGTFLVGFQGDLEVEDLEDEYDEGGGRITTRTVWLQKKAEPAEEPVKGEEIESAHNDENEDDKNSDSGDGRRHSGAFTIKQTNLEEFRIVVYTNHPFIFAFIFDSQASHLTNPSFYRGLHHQLSPLQKLLVSSSSSSSAAKESLQTHASSPTPSPKPPFHVLYDPNTGTLNSTLPPIPHPGPDADQNWTRTDAIHIHTLILSILTEISGEKNERERSARSTRGWWVCWIRLEKGREGFFVRKAAEKKVEGSMGVGGPGAGVVVDVRRHFEGLFKDVR